MDNLDFWDKIKQPPASVLKPITGGRLKGKTDISPQWRVLAMTEIFGPCGIGWKYEIVRLWSEPGCNDQTFAFAEIKLYIKDENGVWSEPIPGIGGSMLVEKESSGLHASDEGYKMAVTDALSVAMKMLGMAADIYMGMWDGSKYAKADTKKEGKQDDKSQPPFPDFFTILDKIKNYKKIIIAKDGNDKAYYEALNIYGIHHANEFKTRDAMINFGKDLKAYCEKIGALDGK